MTDSDRITQLEEKFENLRTQVIDCLEEIKATVNGGRT